MVLKRSSRFQLWGPCWTRRTSAVSQPKLPYFPAICKGRPTHSARRKCAHRANHTFMCLASFVKRSAVCVYLVDTLDKLPSASKWIMHMLFIPLRHLQPIIVSHRSWVPSSGSRLLCSLSKALSWTKSKWEEEKRKDFLWWSCALEPAIPASQALLKKEIGIILVKAFMVLASELLFFFFFLVILRVSPYEHMGWIHESWHACR